MLGFLPVILDLVIVFDAIPGLEPLCALQRREMRSFLAPSYFDRVQPAFLARILRGFQSEGAKTLRINTLGPISHKLASATANASSLTAFRSVGLLHI
jgi:hypothetical protein